MGRPFISQVDYFRVVRPSTGVPGPILADQGRVSRAEGVSQLPNKPSIPEPGTFWV